MHAEPLTILGAGDLGTALGFLLARADWPLVGICDRDRARALEATLLLGCPAFPDPREPVSRSRFVVLALPEGEVQAAAAALEGALHPGTVLAHTGLAGSDVLAGAELPLALRPIGFVPAARSGETTRVLLEGPDEAVRRGAVLVRAVGGLPVPATPRQRLLALAAVALAERGRAGCAARLWDETGLLPWEGGRVPRCEGPHAVDHPTLVPLLDPATARLLSEEEPQ